MHVKELTVKNFRNYSYLNIKFSDDINFIIGENGTGKTNIIEAISITSNLRSFRNIPDSEIIKWGDESYFCSSVVENSDYRIFEVGCAYISGKIKKRVKINNKEVRKASDYYGKLLTVIFSPVDINIINGPPDMRRKFFDSVLSKIDTDYLNTLNEFRKIISSRNKLLKLIKEKKSGDFNQLEIWDQMFSEKASAILKKRINFLNRFHSIFKKSYSDISKDDRVPEILYSSSTKSIESEKIFDTLQRRRSRDILTGSTGIGPQRDDYILTNNKINFVNFASQGQRRTAAISLKISEYEIIEEKTGEKSIIIVDDIFSELDEKRRKNMINMLRRGNQIIFTMVNAGWINMNEYKNLKNFIVEPEGKVSEI